MEFVDKQDKSNLVVKCKMSSSEHIFDKNNVTITILLTTFFWLKIFGEICEMIDLYTK